ncbi:MAG: hypothetical protein A2174_00760, partial [Candidatus Portnoybacteria bacterium RBG_13_41_18]
MRLSYSALDTFKQCPQKYKFQYVEKISAPKSKEAIFGTLIHSALKYFHEPELIISPTEEDLLSFWSANWAPENFPDTREEAALFAQGVQILKNYYAKNAGQKFNILALETSFEAPIQASNDTHIITGKIDRIDKTDNEMFEVIDYKTSKSMPAQKIVDVNLQLSVYHIGVANRWPQLIKENRSIKTSLYFLKHGEKLSSIKTNEHLSRAQENIIGLLEQIKKAHQEEKFPPFPGPLCAWCAYQKICPVWKHKFRTEKIFFNDQDIKTLINEYVFLKNEIDERDKKMSEIKQTFSKFMDQENMERLFSDEGYISRQLIQRFKYDPLLLRQILE